MDVVSPSSRSQISPLIRPPHGPRSGVTLVEVMVASGILAFVATALLGVFLQNQRFSYHLAYRSQAVTTSLSLLEQLRFRQYAEIADIYNLGVDGSVDVTIVDPSTSEGYSTLTLPVNVLDGTEVNEDWTGASIVVDPDASAVRLPMRFFLCLSQNRATGANAVDVFEIVLLYRYQQAASGGGEWQTGNVRLVVPNLNPML